jgi:hypothetical protein
MFEILAKNFAGKSEIINDNELNNQKRIKLKIKIINLALLLLRLL